MEIRREGKKIEKKNLENDEVIWVGDDEDWNDISAIRWPEKTD